MKFTEISRPFIVGVITDDDVNNCIRTIKLGEFDGADGFQLQLQSFKKFPPTKEQMKDIICSTNKPIWTTNRRPKRGVEAHPNRLVSEEKRMQLQLDALDAGAACIDMELDTFDHWALWDEARRKSEWPTLKDIPVDLEDFPQECSFQREAIEKQKEIIDQVHSVGGEVLMSCHIKVRTTQAGALRIGREMEARGADIAKIVTWNDDFYDLCDTLRDNVYLKENMKIPFKLMSQGEPSKLGRALFAMFGSAWAFCLHDLSPGGFHYRPLISTVQYIMQHVDWEPNWERHRKYT